MAKYRLSDARRVTTYTSNWGYFAIRPVSDRMLWIVANYVNTTPNRLTLFSFVINLAAAWSFYNAKPAYLVIGGLLFELAYAIDCIDGGLARLTGRTSKIGAYLDDMTAYWGLFFVVLGLAYGQFTLTGDLVYLLLGFAYLFIHLVSWLEYFVSQKSGFTASDSDSSPIPVIQPDSLVGRIRTWLHAKHIIIGLTVTDVDALVLFVFPIINQAKAGLFLGFCLILAQFMLSWAFMFWNQRRH